MKKQDSCLSDVNPQHKRLYAIPILNPTTTSTSQRVPASSQHATRHNVQTRLKLAHKSVQLHQPRRSACRTASKRSGRRVLGLNRRRLLSGCPRRARRRCGSRLRVDDRSCRGWGGGCRECSGLLKRIGHGGRELKGQA